MNILAIDTSAALCAAAVYDATGNKELGRHVLDLGKGHAEHLMAVIDRALGASNISYRDLGRIAVSIGPGSFTGIRVGVSTARGLSLALKVPAVGISTLEAVAAEVRLAHDQAPVFAVFESARGELQGALYDAAGAVLLPPAILDLQQAAGLAADHHAILAGSAARKVSEAAGGQLTIASEAITADIAVYARLATTKDADGEKPKPLYLREPDAKPQAGFVLPRV